jgi:peptidoglycan/xylan/chitin deacetylase (PgdA/CDA1 family)
MRRWAIIATALATVPGVGIAVAAITHDSSSDADALHLPTLPEGVTTLDPPVLPIPEPLHPTHDPIPILMYHVIADPSADAPYPELYVSGEDFARQIDWLESHGFHAVTLRAAYLHWSFGSSIPTHPIVITFDDGYHSQFATAAPILSSHRWEGVLDLEVRNTERSWGVSEKQVRELIAEGWELAAHTLTHPDLTQLSGVDLQHEVAGSRKALQEMFGARVDFFCYPAGRLNDKVVAAVVAAGYLGATTTAPGLATPADMFRLNRVRVERSDGVAGLAAKLRALGAA